MPVEEKYKPRNTLRTAKKKTRGVIGCKTQCTKLHTPGTEEWFTCMEECQRKAKEAQAATA